MNNHQPRKAFRAHGVPATKGPLKITYADGSQERIGATTADRQAREVVRKTQGGGKFGRDL